MSSRAATTNTVSFFSLFLLTEIAGFLSCDRTFAGGGIPFACQMRGLLQMWVQLGCVPCGNMFEVDSCL